MSAFVTRAPRAACTALLTVALALTGDNARAQQHAPAPRSRVTTIADEYMTMYFARNPEFATLEGVP